MAVSNRPRPGRPAGSQSFDARSARAFGEVVREARLQAGLSQEALASDASFARSHFSRIERGLSQPTLHAMIKIAAALGVTATALVERTEHRLARRPRP